MPIESTSDSASKEFQEFLTDIKPDKYKETGELLRHGNIDSATNIHGAEGHAWMMMCRHLHRTVGLTVWKEAGDDTAILLRSQDHAQAKMTVLSQMKAQMEQAKAFIGSGAELLGRRKDKSGD